MLIPMDDVQQKTDADIHKEVKLLKKDEGLEEKMKEMIEAKFTGLEQVEEQLIKDLKAIDEGMKQGDSNEIAQAAEDAIGASQKFEERAEELLPLVQDLNPHFNEDIVGDLQATIDGLGTIRKDVEAIRDQHFGS